MLPGLDGEYEKILRDTSAMSQSDDFRAHMRTFPLCDGVETILI
jgi:hypothetical protein